MREGLIFGLLAPFAKRTFLLSRLPLMRELPSVSEAEGEKDYPSVTCGDSSPDKGSQECGETCCKKTKNRADA